MAEKFEPSNDPLLASPEGKNAIDITQLNNYDENSSLDDIKQNYTDLGNRFGNLVENAVKDVSRRQVKLIGNDFGGVNPQLRSTYYQPSETAFKSSMNIEGTQKALEVGMERGKAAAEANYNAAQNEYNNAYSAYENFRNAVENGKYTVATFDESLLPEGMTLEEFENLSEIEGMTKEEYINNRIEALQNLNREHGIDWNVYEDADAANNAIYKKYNTSWEQIQAMPEEERAQFWKNVGMDWRNAYWENQIRRTYNSEAAVEQYRESVRINSELFGKIYDSYQQGESILENLGMLDNMCVPLFNFPSFEDQEQFSNKWEEGTFTYAYNDNYDSMTIAQRNNLTDIDWLKQNLDEETYNKALQYMIDNSTGPGRWEDDARKWINGMYDIVKGKLHNQSNGSSEVLTQYAYSSVADTLGFDLSDLKSYIALKRSNPEMLETMKTSYAMARGLISMMEVADGDKYYLINGKYQRPDAGTVIMMSMPGTTNDDGSFNSKEYETGLKALQDLQNPLANHTDEQKKALEDKINESFNAYAKQCAYQATIQAVKPSRTDYKNMFLEALVLSDVEKYKDLEFTNDKGEKVSASEFLRDFNELIKKDSGAAYKLYSDAMYQTYKEHGYIYVGSDDGSVHMINIMNGDNKHTNVFSFENDKKGTGNDIYEQYGHGLSADTIFNLLSAGINIYNNKGKSDKQEGQDFSYYVNPDFIREGVVGDNSNGANFINGAAYSASQFVGIIWNALAFTGSFLATGFENTANAITGGADRNKNPFTESKFITWDTITGAVNNAANDLGNDASEYEGQTLQELFTEPRVEDSYAQWYELNEFQQDNVARAINAVTMYTWFGTEDGKISSQGLGTSANASKAVADNGFLHFLNDNGIDFLGFSSMFSGDYQFWRGTGKFAGTLVGYKLMSAATAKVTGAIKEAASAASTNLNLALSDAIIKETANLQPIVASSLASSTNIAATSAQIAGTAAANAAINSAALGGKVTEEAIKSAKLAYSKTAAKIANGTANQEVVNQFQKSFIETVKSSKYYDGLVSQLGEKGTETFLRNMSTNSSAVMQEIVSNSAIGNVTGLSVNEVSKLTSRDQRLLTKVIEQMGEGTGVSKLNQTTWFKEKFLKSLTQEELTEVTKAIIDGTTENAALGLKWTTEDTARVLQSKGWLNASKGVFAKEFMKDMAGDVFRDNLRNLTNPYYTAEGYQRQSVEEYFTNPNTWVQNFLSSAWQFGKQRLNAEVMTSISYHMKDRALNAVASTGESSGAGSLKAKKNAQYWTMQAQKWSNAAFKSGSNYSRIKKLITNSSRNTLKAQTEMYGQMGIDVDFIEVETGGSKYRFENTDEFKKWSEENKVDSFDALNVGLKSAIIDAEGRYVVNAMELGGDIVRGLGSLNATDMLIDMHKIELQTREENIEAVKKDPNLTIYQKSEKLYNMMTDAIVAKYGDSNAVVGLRKSLNMYYQNFLDELNTRVETLKKKGMSEQEILDSNLIRLGYTPIASWYNQTPFEDKVLRGMGWGSQTVDKMATDTAAERGVYEGDLLAAFARGETVYQLKNSKGEVIKEYTLDKRGLNYLDSLTVYQNSNMAKRILTPIFGTEKNGKFDMAGSAMRMRYAYIESTDAAVRAATYKRDEANRRIDEIVKNVSDAYLNTANVSSAESVKAYDDAKNAALAESEEVLSRNIQNKERLIEYAQKVRAQKAEAEKVKNITSGQLPKEFEALPAVVLGMYDSFYGPDGKFSTQNINVDAGKKLYDVAVDDARKLIKYYNDGAIDDSGTFHPDNLLDEPTKKIKLHTGIEIELDEQDMAKIQSAAASGQEFDMDLVMSVMIKSRKAEISNYYDGLKAFADKAEAEGIEKAHSKVRAYEEFVTKSIAKDDIEQLSSKKFNYAKPIEISSKPNEELMSLAMKEISKNKSVKMDEVMTLGTDSNDIARGIVQGLLAKSRADDENAGVPDSLMTRSLSALANKLAIGKVENENQKVTNAKKKAKEWSTAEYKQKHKSKENPSGEMPWQEAYNFLYRPTGFTETLPDEDGGTYTRNIGLNESRYTSFEVLPNGKYSEGSDRIFDIVFSAMGENMKKFNTSGELDRTDQKLLSALRTQLDTQLRTEVGEKITLGELTQRLVSMMPDTKIYSEAKESKLIEKFSALDADNISVAQLRDIVSDDFVNKRTAGKLTAEDEDKYLQAISLLTDMQESSTRPRLRVETEKLAARGSDEDNLDDDVAEAGETVAGTSGVKPKTDAEEFLEQYGNEKTKNVTAYDRESVLSATKALGEIMGGFYNKRNKYYSSALSEANKARRDVDNFITAKSEEILTKAKVLYKTNQDFKNMVDSWSENRKQSQAKAGVKEIKAEPTDNDYLNALGLVRPGYELSTTGNSKNHKTAEEYYAALNNIDTISDIRNGYAPGVYNRIYLAANRKGAHLQQLTDAIAILKGFGVTVKDVTPQMNELLSKLNYSQLTVSQLNDIKQAGPLAMLPSKTESTWKRMLKSGETISYADLNKYRMAKQQIAEAQNNIRNPKANKLTGNVGLSLTEAKLYRADIEAGQFRLNELYSKFKGGNNSSKKIDALFENAITELGKKNEDIFSLARNLVTSNDSFYNDAVDNIENSFYGVSSYVYDPSLSKLLVLSKKEAASMAKAIKNKLEQLDKGANKAKTVAKTHEASTAGDALKGFVNHSGGAVGADSVWGEEGAKYGATSNHYYYGKKTPNGNTEISKEAFEDGKQHVLKANETLHRQPDKYMDLLSRNWQQVKNADAIYAIGTRQKPNIRGGAVQNSQSKFAPTVNGGTGWAVQMAVDAGKTVYLFDQDVNRWFTIEDGKWKPIDTPTLTKNYAGIGTREINENGRAAIAEVYRKTAAGEAESEVDAAKTAEISRLLDQFDYYENYADRQYVDPTTGKRSFFTRTQAEDSLPGYDTERITRSQPYEPPMRPIVSLDQLAPSIKESLTKDMYASVSGRGKKTRLRLYPGENVNGVQQVNLNVSKKYSEEQVQQLMRNAYGVEPTEYDIVDSYVMMEPKSRYVNTESGAKKLFAEQEYYNWLHDVNEIIMRAKKMSKHPDYAEEVQKLYTEKGEAVKRLAEAREFGDLSENEEYRAARDELKQITKKIDELNSAMRTPAGIKNSKGELVKNPEYISTPYDDVMKLMHEGSDRTWKIVFKDDSELYNNTEGYEESQAKRFKEGLDAGEGWVPGGESINEYAKLGINLTEDAASAASEVSSAANRFRANLEENRELDTRYIAEPDSYYAKVMSSLIGDQYRNLRQAEVDYDETYLAYLRLSEDFTMYKQKVISGAEKSNKKLINALDQYEKYFNDANPGELLMKKLLKENKSKYNKLMKKKEAAEKNIADAEETARRLTGDEQFEELKKLIKQKHDAERFLNSDDEKSLYVSPEGDVFVKDGYRAPGSTTVNDALKSLGWDDSYVRTSSEDTDEFYTKENRKKRKAMQKEINKNLNQNASGKKTYKPYEAIDFTHLDEASRKATMNNILDFKDSMKDLMNSRYGIEGEVNTVVDKNYMDLLQVIVARDKAGVDNRKNPMAGDKRLGDSKLSDVGNEIKYLGKESVNKFLTITRAGVQIAKATQDFQMAGGFANINAMSIVQLRQYMYQQFSLNPLKASKAIKDFINVAYNTRNSAAAYNIATELLPFLQENANLIGDTNPLTDLNGVLSRTPGYDDGGTVSSLVSSMLKHVDELSSSNKGFGSKLKQLMIGNPAENFKILFSDATFKNTLPVFRAWMLKQNYDEAMRYLKRTGQLKNMTAEEANRACHGAAYGKTLEFFEPAKTRGKTLAEILENAGTAADRRRLASFTGMKRGASYLDVAGDIFFALRYKMALGGQVVSGIREALSPSAMMRRGRVLLNRGEVDTDLEGNPIPGKNDYLDTFVHSGSLKGIGALVTIGVINHFWCRAMGIPSPWDSTQYIDEKGNLMIPEILKKIQTIGQFWMPNAYSKEKGFYMDPNKKMVALDTMSSTFTLTNSVFKTVDKSINTKAYNHNQRGIGLFGQMLGINPQGINNVLNNDVAAAIGDELIASNMLSPWKAMYEILTDNTYFGNNIWEKKYLPDGSENKNYDPFRNMTASFFHLLNLDWFLTNGTNAWVKGKYKDYENRVVNKNYVAQDNIGTVAGSGVFQHEFVTAAIQIINGDALGGIIEAGEIPIKTRTLSTQARTEFNTKVKNTVMQLAEEYKAKVKYITDPDTKDRYYKEFVKEAADTVASWSKKWNYVLGENQELVAYATRALMAICAGEYDDNLNYVQNAYWKASTIAQIEQPADLFLSDEDLEAWIASGKTEEEFAKEREKRSAAWNQALLDEYEAIKALEAAGVDTSYITRDAADYFDAMKSSVNKKVYEGIHEVLNQPIGEFKNFKEMKVYYEEQINAATSTKTKAKLAEKYNGYLKEALAPFVKEYGAAIFKDGYYNKEGLANSIADYVIIPADKYYRGKTPRASYLKDMFGVGYTDKSNLPSDDEIIERFVSALRAANSGSSASASRLLDGIIKDVKSGRLYATDRDYSRIVNMKALLSARSK